MPSTARVFDVPPTLPGGKAPTPVERPRVTLEASGGDAAKREAIARFEGTGFLVRSINWGPSPAGIPELIVYLSKDTRKKQLTPPPAKAKKDHPAKPPTQPEKKAKKK